MKNVLEYYYNEVFIVFCFIFITGKKQEGYSHTTAMQAISCIAELQK